MAETASLVTREMQRVVGEWRSGAVSPPVCASDIRRWAVAVYWPDQPPPLFWDSGYATTTPWDGIVAPEDFNPFAWPVSRQTRTAAVNEQGLPIDSLGLPVPRRGSGSGVHAAGPSVGGMNAGREDEFGARLRPGDVITSRERLTGWKQTATRLGPSLFATIEVEWTNQRADLVRRRTQQVLRYIQPEDSGDRREPVRREPAVVSEFPAWSRQTGIESWNRYAAVNDEFVDIHMSDEAGRRAGNPGGAFGMGNLRYAYLLNAIREWLGIDARVVSLACQFRALNRKGDLLTVRGRTTTQEARINGDGRLDLELDVANQQGESTCPATAVVVVPQKHGV